jgi:hypothetical protein
MAFALDWFEKRRGALWVAEGQGERYTWRGVVKVQGQGERPYFWDGRVFEGAYLRFANGGWAASPEAAQESARAYLAKTLGMGDT